MPGWCWQRWRPARFGARSSGGWRSRSPTAGSTRDSGSTMRSEQITDGDGRRAILMDGKSGFAAANWWGNGTHPGDATHEPLQSLCDLGDHDLRRHRHLEPGRLSPQGTGHLSHEPHRHRVSGLAPHDGQQRRPDTERREADKLQLQYGAGPLSDGAPGKLPAGNHRHVQRDNHERGQLFGAHPRGPDAVRAVRFVRLDSVLARQPGERELRQGRAVVPDRVQLDGLPGTRSA